MAEGTGLPGSDAVAVEVDLDTSAVWDGVKRTLDNVVIAGSTQTPLDGLKAKLPQRRWSDADLLLGIESYSCVYELVRSEMWPNSSRPSLRTSGL